MRGPTYSGRLVAAAVVVLAALGLVALAARSDRPATLTQVATASPAAVPPGGTRVPLPDGNTATPTQDTSATHMPGWLVWTMAIVAIAPIVLTLVFVPALVYGPRLRLWSIARRRRRPEPPPPVDDEVSEAALAAAVEQGLWELDQGGAGEGVVASWVLLEQAAADAGTHRAAPDTPSELVGRLLDRHAVSSTPLLRLADLYREARFSRHQLSEPDRAEARAALEQLRAELAASPLGGRR